MRDPLGWRAARNLRGKTMVFQYSAPTSRGSNLAGTTLNSLANGSESGDITVDNSTNRYLYALVTLKLGSINPSSGASVQLRVRASDGVDVPDKIGGELYPFLITSGSSAKIQTILIALRPFSLRFSFVNNTGVALAGSGNEVYASFYGEE